jgi:hypothetical protein
MKTLVVALASFDTQRLQHNTLDVRINWLRQCAQKAYEVAMQHMLQFKKPLEYPFGLFVAPEYLLAAPSPTGSHGIGTQRHMSEAEKEQRLQMLQEISRPCKGMIMIPGTIAWQKPFIRTGAKQFHSKGPLVGQLKAV